MPGKNDFEERTERYLKERAARDALLGQSAARAKPRKSLTADAKHKNRLAGTFAGIMIVVVAIAGGAVLSQKLARQVFGVSAAQIAETIPEASTDTPRDQSLIAAPLPEPWS